MLGVPVEDLPGLWSSELRGAKARLRPLFLQADTAASTGAFLDGLLGPERRKTGWMRAEAAGDTGPWRQQAVLGRASWDADALDIRSEKVDRAFNVDDGGTDSLDFVLKGR